MSGRTQFCKRGAISGVVVRGKGLGRTVGMPTANLEVDGGFRIPEDGVYSAIVRLGEEEFLGVTNVGRRPTVDSDERVTVETFILDFDRIIYGERLELTFIEKIRETKRFGSLSELKAQVDLDAAEARKAAEKCGFALEAHDKNL